MALTQAEIDVLPSRYVNKKSHLPYEMAKKAVNELAPHVNSAAKYRKWIKETKSYYMPVHPERVYKDFSWEHFLRIRKQVNFVERVVKYREKRANYLPMYEAMRWSQRYCRENGITTYKQWMEAYKNDDSIPDNIPYNPKSIYAGQGFSVYTWCGVNAEAVQEVESNITPVLTLLHPSNVSQNVVQLVSWPGGEGELHDKWRKQSDFDRIYGSWVYERELMSEVERILSENGSSDGERWTISNLNQLTWELNSLLEMVKL